MVKVMLVKKAQNFAFFCPESKLHLTLRNPIGQADGVTKYMERAIRAGKLRVIEPVEEVEAKEEHLVQPLQEVEEVEEILPLEVEEEKPKRAKGKKKAE